MIVLQMFTTQAWTDGEPYTFNVNEADKEGLEIDDPVVLLTGVNSNYNNTRIYGTVLDLSRVGRITILVNRTVIE